MANALAVADDLVLSDPEAVPVALEKAVRGIDVGLRELARVPLTRKQRRRRRSQGQRQPGPGGRTRR